jgi:hypothetical protein
MSVVIAQRRLGCGKVIIGVIKEPGVQHPGALSACRHLFLNALIFSIFKTFLPWRSDFFLLLDFAPCSHNEAGHDTLRLLAASDKMELTVRLCKKKTCLCQQINTTKANVGAKMARLIDNLTSGTYCVLLFPLGDAPREATLLLFHRHRNSSPRSKFAHTSNLHNLSNAIIRVVDALLLNEPFQIRSQSRTELGKKCSLTGTILPTKAACVACCRSRYA